MSQFALIGNPNTGKTSLFNILTDSYEYVGNWSGVTVEKKVGKVKKVNKEILESSLKLN
jgi:ferrous iron transport protein B